MSDPRTSSSARLADLVIPLAAVGYAGYYVVSVRNFPYEAQITGFLLGTVLVGLCVAFFARFAWQAFQDGAVSDFGALLGTGELRVRRLVFCVLTVACIAAVPWGGFTLTTFVFLFASFLVLGVRPLARAAVVAATAATAGWLFFIVALGTRFPKGPFERLLDWVM